MRRATIAPIAPPRRPYLVEYPSQQSSQSVALVLAIAPSAIPPATPIPAPIAPTLKRDFRFFVGIVSPHQDFAYVIPRRRPCVAGTFTTSGKSANRCGTPLSSTGFSRLSVA